MGKRRQTVKGEEEERTGAGMLGFEEAQSQVLIPLSSACTMSHELPHALNELVVPTFQGDCNNRAPPLHPDDSREEWQSIYQRGNCELYAG